jgi:hypothetical protein
MQMFAYALALLNHEHCAFALPFVLLRPQLGENSARKLILRGICLGIAFVPFLLYRRMVYTQVAVSPFPLSMYLEWFRSFYALRRVARLLPIGIFEAFRLIWFVPLVAGYGLWNRRQTWGVAWMCLVFLCALSQLLFATDTSRYLGLAFPVVLYGLEVLGTQLTEKDFAKWAGFLFLLNLFVPVYYVGQSRMIPLYPLPLSFVLQALGIDAWELWWK